jgi:hypothetical protein
VNEGIDVNPTASSALEHLNKTDFPSARWKNCQRKPQGHLPRRMRQPPACTKEANNMFFDLVKAV